MFSFIVEGALMSAVCAAGFIGNVAAILNFGKARTCQKNFYTFMLYLALCDLIYIIVSILLFVLPNLSSDYKSNGPWHYVVPWAIPFGQISLTGSVYFTMVITIERYLTVCQPFYMVSRKWRAEPTVAGVILFAIAYNTPKFFEFSTSYELCSLNRTLSESICTLTINSQSCEKYLRVKKLFKELSYTICVNFTSNGAVKNPSTLLNNHSISSFKYSAPASEMRLNSFYVQLYATNLTFFINGIIPFAVIITLNILILKELLKFESQMYEKERTLIHRNGSTRGDRKSNKQRTEIGTAKISLIIALVFIMCHLVKWVPNMHEIIMHSQGKFPSYNATQEYDEVVTISFDTDNGNRIDLDSSNATPEQLDKEKNSTDNEKDWWPPWVDQVTCLSHLALAFNSSVNYYIYYFKRRSLRRAGPKSRETCQEENTKTFDKESIKLSGITSRA